MDKKSIALIKQKCPALFAWVVKSPFLARLASEMDRGRFIYCMLTNKPYFGTVALAGQTWEERKSYMVKAVQIEIRKNSKTNFTLLEIGSWAGDSAILWANAIKTTGCKAQVFCVDAWSPYIDEAQEKINAATIMMNQALKKGRIFDLFLHNVRASGHEDTIVPIKAKSDAILPFFKKASFDTIYVDGDHSYSGMKRDLANAVGLIPEGGILCGDDLNLTVDQIDRKYADLNREVNMVIDPKTERSYHPGVTLALWELFGGEISSYNGFWIMRKSANGWERVEL